MTERFTASSERSAVNGCIEAADHFETIAGPQAIGSSLKAAINTIVAEIRRATGYQIKPSRVEDIWRKEARRIDWQEMDAIRATAAARAKAKETSDAEYAADLAEVLERLAVLEELALGSKSGRFTRSRAEKGRALDVVERILGGEA